MRKVPGYGSVTKLNSGQKAFRTIARAYLLFAILNEYTKKGPNVMTNDYHFLRFFERESTGRCGNIRHTHNKSDRTKETFCANVLSPITVVE